TAATAAAGRECQDESQRRDRSKHLLRLCFECSSVVRRANHNTRRERLVARVTFGIGYCARRSVRVSNENPRVRTAPCSSPCGHDNCPAQTKNPRRFPGGGLLSSRRLSV